MSDPLFPADGSAEYKVCRTPDPKAWLWARFAPSGHTFGPPTFQLTLSARGRSVRAEVPVLASSSTRPLATVTLSGEAFPLTVGWHERRRGGTLAFGGERRTGQSGTVCWQMAWTPDKTQPGVFDVALWVQSVPRRTGDLRLSLPVALFAPTLHALPSAAERGHAAHMLFSSYSRSALWLAATEADPQWNADTGCWEFCFRRFPLGGGKTVRFVIGMTPAASAQDARPHLVTSYARLAEDRLHALPHFPQIDPALPAALLSDPARYAAPGTERLYLQPPGAADGGVHGLTAWAGAPFYPLDALKQLADWGRLHPSEHAPRLVRFGAAGVAADCQVMGRGELPQPNKGAFWDKVENGWGKAATGEPSHGIRSNARMARGLFLLHGHTGDALLRQSALNICQWLILKSNEQGFWDGAFVQATTGTDTDGKVIPAPDGVWDGADAVRAFVLAFRATRNEVYVKAAWKAARALLERLPAEGDALPSATLATVVLNLLALLGEADNAELRTALDVCGVRLLTAPLPSGVGDDGLHFDLFECAAAAFGLHALSHDPMFLRLGLCALAAVPPTSAEQSWRASECYSAALLSLCGLVGEARADFDAVSAYLDWRHFAPDPATDRFVQMARDDGRPLWTLPLVCRASSQMLVLALAPPDAETFTLLLTGGRRPPVFDLISGTREAVPLLHSLGGKNRAERPWARAAVLVVDP